MDIEFPYCVVIILKNKGNNRFEICDLVFKNFESKVCNSHINIAWPFPFKWLGAVEFRNNEVNISMRTTIFIRWNN